MGRALRDAHGGGSIRLAGLLTRFGEAIEADLFGRADVVVLWQQRRWRTLLNLIDHIPAASHLGEALANDDDAAHAWLAQRGDDQSESRPKYSQFDPHLAELTVLNERVGTLISATAAVGGSSIKIPPRPRPLTAFDRVRDEVRRAKHNSLVKRLLPGRGDDT